MYCSYNFVSRSALTDNRHFSVPTADKHTENSEHHSKECGVGMCKSKQNDPKVWGPFLWKYMHFMTKNLSANPSEEEKQDMKNWLCALPVTIPCDVCKRHFKDFINEHRSGLDEICGNKDKLFALLVDAHNRVNRRNNKSTMTIEEARKMYS